MGSFKLLSRLGTVNTDSIARGFQNGASNHPCALGEGRNVFTAILQSK